MATNHDYQRAREALDELQRVDGVLTSSGPRPEDVHACRNAADEALAALRAVLADERSRMPDDTPEGDDLRGRLQAVDEHLDGALAALRP